MSGRSIYRKQLGNEFHSVQSRTGKCCQCTPNEKKISKLLDVLVFYSKGARKHKETYGSASIECVPYIQDDGKRARKVIEEVKGE